MRWTTRKRGVSPTWTMDIDPASITWQRVMDTNEGYLRKITIGSEGNMNLLSLVFFSFSPMRIAQFLRFFAAPLHVSPPFFSSFIHLQISIFTCFPFLLPHRSILEGFDSRGAVRHHGRLWNHGHPASCRFWRLSGSRRGTIYFICEILDSFILTRCA